MHPEDSMNLDIQPGNSLQGTLHLPPSKSQSIRAILFASLARGKSRIRQLLNSPDTQAMINACQAIGASIETDMESSLLVHGVSGKPSLPEQMIDADNSGQVFRFITAISALIPGPGYSRITGDESIRHRRPIIPLLDALQQLGAISRRETDGSLRIQGPIHAGPVRIDGRDSQPVSALLIVSLFLKGCSEIQVRHPGETPWIELTLSWFDRLKLHYERSGFDSFRIQGPQSIHAFDYTVPGDLSALAYPLVAGLITQSELHIHDVDLSDSQGDKKLLEYLEAMGARLSYQETTKTLHIPAGQSLQGIDLDANACIDAVPILAVLGTYASGTTRISNIAIAQFKESKRITTTQKELAKMGASIIADKDSLEVQQSRLHAASLDSHQDHRIAMALAVAALNANGQSRIHHSDCIRKSYPSFVKDFSTLGAGFKQIH